MIIRGAVLIVAVIIWLMFASWLLDFGNGLKFDQFQALGQQALDLFVRINPYLWWGVVVIWSLIIFFMTRAWLCSDIASGRAKAVPVSELSPLTAELSQDTLGVVRWVWGNREEPLTLGDLRQVGIELRHHRVDRLDLVREQSRIIDAQQTATPRAQTVAAPIAAPSGHRIEPNL